jgi:hypothetical protein
MAGPGLIDPVVVVAPPVPPRNVSNRVPLASNFVRNAS